MKLMDSPSGPGENRRTSSYYWESLQRRPDSEDAVSCFYTYRLSQQCPCITSCRLPSFGYVRSASNPSPNPLLLRKGGSKNALCRCWGRVLLLPFRAAKGEVGRGWLVTARCSCIGAVAGFKPAARALHQSLPASGRGRNAINRHFMRDATPDHKPSLSARRWRSRRGRPRQWSQCSRCRTNCAAWRPS